LRVGGLLRNLEPPLLLVGGDGAHGGDARCTVAESGGSAFVVTLSA
jgi:hypothetical protein